MYKPGPVPTGDLASTQRYLRVELARIAQTTGQLQSDIDNAPIAIGSKVLLQTINNVTPGEFDFLNINQGYDDLIIEGEVRGNVNAEGETARIFFNGDTVEASYYHQSNRGRDGASATDEAANAYIFSAPGAALSVPTDSWAQVVIRIPRYTSAIKKQAFCDYTARETDTRMNMGQAAVASLFITAIDRIQIQANTHPTDQLLGELRLYGVADA